MLYCMCIRILCNPTKKIIRVYFTSMVGIPKALKIKEEFVIKEFELFGVHCVYLIVTFVNGYSF